MIQTEDIKEYMKKRSTLQNNIIKIYGLIWGQWYPYLQRELEGNLDYTTYPPTYDWLQLFTNIKICTSGIDCTSSGYYSVFMSMRTIVCLQQGKYEPSEAYYKSFEAAISMYEIVKWTDTTHMQLSRTQTGEDDDDVTKRFQSMCLLILSESDWFSGIWNDLNNNTLLST